MNEGRSTHGNETARARVSIKERSALSLKDGGANVRPLKPMEIPEDIKAVMRPYFEM